MPKNSKYYYQIETTGSKYSTTQSNVLDVPRLLQHKPYWRQPFGEVLVKKKVLVINYHDLKDLDKDDLIVLIDRVEALQQEGFEVYEHLDGAVHKFDIPFLQSIKFSNNSSTISDKKLGELAAKKLQLSHDQILVLNPPELEELMQGTNDDWSELPSFHTVDLHETNISIASLTELIRTSGARIRSLNLSHCVNLKKGTLPEYISLKNLEELIIQDDSRSNPFNENRQFNT